ncbi:hypothetical protein I305_01081 [Cryptococcus gattii E566]|uniref:Uncharacterized protein n=2 Tax=Cryptococcus gattii TaxID=37769 RepID=E6R0E1_CRYGW|nr:Hypothetical Protein CGB_B2910C [Cryptococcus gattii WM276]ADV20707.1 Hypothetical Protein CGB_B2910C [Cryptococcus gattii WM276]KIR77217.1 hypothetical protein I306_05808 [Cryptococcus gattii EJB2]KIY36225.1 hypothetical protein I305_01081 [Cryptococcus gattii E566]KJE06124.1 hypothetical protein I311_00265 [Cryptococcus gattii NT-10]
MISRRNVEVARKPPLMTRGVLKNLLYTTDANAVNGPVNDSSQLEMFWACLFLDDEIKATFSTTNALGGQRLSSKAIGFHQVTSSTRTFFEPHQLELIVEPPLSQGAMRFSSSSIAY